MKCSHCGAQLPEGEVICPMCGLEVQLVPNYETLDLDMMVEQNNIGEMETLRLTEQRRERKKYLGRRRILKCLIGIVIAAIAAIGITSAVMNIRASMNTTVDFEDVFGDAMKAYEAEEYQNAYSIVCEALNMVPDSVEAKVLKARTAHKLENDNEAVSILRTMIANDETCEQAYEALIEVYLDQGDYDVIYELLSGVSNEAISQRFADYLCSPPVFSLEDGTYNEEQDISITADEGAVIYFTTDGNAPSEQSEVYTAPIHIGEGSITIQAVAVNGSGMHSPTAVKTYTINFDAPNAPQIETPSGSYTGDDNKITVAVPEGCTAFYAFDKKPTTDDPAYTGPVEMPEGSHIFYVFLVNEKGISGSIAAATYVYTPKPPVTQAPPTPAGSGSGGNTGGSGSGYSGGGSSGGSSGGGGYTPTAAPATPAPTEVTPAPTEVTPAPTEVTPEPTEVTPEPPAPTEEPTPEPPAPTEEPTPEPPAPTEEPAPSGGGEEGGSSGEGSEP